jgi:hypothetical protein
MKEMMLPTIAQQKSEKKSIRNLRSSSHQDTCKYVATIISITIGLSARFVMSRYTTGRQRYILDGAPRFFFSLPFSLSA